MAQLGARVNGIHEVTGSIPVWSTSLRSRKAGRSVSFGWASPGEGCPAEAQSAKADDRHALDVSSSCDNSRSCLAIAATLSVDNLISVR